MTDLVKNPKFCLDCIHLLRVDYLGDFTYSRCRKFLVSSDYYVNGDLNRIENYKFAGTAREFEHLCGARGKHFESTYIDAVVIIDEPLKLTDGTKPVKKSFWKRLGLTS